MDKQKLGVGDKLYKHCVFTTGESKVIKEYLVIEHRETADGIKYVIECSEYKNIVRGVINAQWEYETTEIAEDSHTYRCFDSVFATHERYKEFYRLTAKEAWLDHYSQAICCIHEDINLLEKQLTAEKAKLSNTNQRIYELRKSLTEN